MRSARFAPNIESFQVSHLRDLDPLVDHGHKKIPTCMEA